MTLGFKAIACTLLVWTTAGCGGSGAASEEAAPAKEQALAPLTSLRVISIGADVPGGVGGIAESAYQLQPNGAFSGWGTLGGHDLRKLAVDRNNDERLMVFVIGGDGIVYGRYQVTAGGGWNADGWGTLGGTDVRKIVSSMSSNGCLELFGLFGDGHAYHRWQLVPGGGWNSEGWVLINGPSLRDLSVGRSSLGREIVAVGVDRMAYYSPEGTVVHQWGAFSSIGFSFNLDRVEVADSAGLVAVGLTADGQVQENHVDPMLQWGSWTSLGVIGPVQQITIGFDFGVLVAFALGNDGHAYMQRYRPSGFWDRAWTSLGGTDLRQLASAQQANDRAVLVARGGDGQAYALTFGTSQPWASLGGAAQSDLVVIEQPL